MFVDFLYIFRRRQRRHLHVDESMFFWRHRTLTVDSAPHAVFIRE